MSSGVPPVKGPEGKSSQEVKSKTDEQARSEKFREMMRVEAVDPEQKRRDTKQGEEAAKKEENEAAAGEDGEIHTAHTAKRQEEKSDVTPFPALFAEAPPSPGPMMGSAAPSEEGVRREEATPPPAAPHAAEPHYTITPSPSPLTPSSTQSAQTQQESSSDEEASDAALEAARQAAALVESIKSGKRPPSQPGETGPNKIAQEKNTKEQEAAASEKKKESAAPPAPKKPDLPAKAGELAKPALPPEEPPKQAATPPSRPPPSKEPVPLALVPPKKSTSEPLLGTAALSATTPHAEEPEEVSPHEAIQTVQPLQEKESLPSRVEKKEKGKEKEVTLPAGPSSAPPLISGLHDAAAPLVHAPIEAPSGSPSPFSTAYSNLHPEVLDILDRLVGQIQVSLANGLQETRVTYSSRIPSSVFNGSQIIVRRYASAADEFNVTIIADPRAAERLRAQLPDLRTALVDPRFKVQRLEVVLATEAAEKGEFQRKEGLSDEEGQSDTEGESR